MRRRIIVTGGFGFIGSYVVYEAYRRKYDVTIIDACTPAAVNREQIERDLDVRVIRGRIEDPQLWDSYDLSCEAILHLAAETHVDRSIGHSPGGVIRTDSAGPYRFIRTNVEGTARVCAHARRVGALLVHFSTDEVYGDALDMTEDIDDVKGGNVALLWAAREYHSYRPSSPYSASKVGAEAVVDAWVRTYGLDARVLRPTNAYGPCQSLDKLIPVAVSRLYAGNPVPLYDGGSQVRQWVHAHDIACAALDVIDAPAFKALNLGGYDLIRNRDVVEMIAKLMRESGLDVPEVPWETTGDRPGHDFAYRVNSDLARDVIDWDPDWRLVDAVPSIVNEAIRRINNS